MTTVNTTPAVEAMGRLHLTGNITPPNWYKVIRVGKKAHLLAITILADVAYWYRPTITRDEETGEIVSITKKFKADKLQKSYAAWADQFGSSKELVKDACDLLESKELIKRDFRNIRTEQGLFLSNVMFVEPNVPNLAAISTPHVEDEKGGISPRKSPPYPPENTPHVEDEKGETYTDTTTEISTENTAAVVVTTTTAKKESRKEERKPEPKGPAIDEKFGLTCRLYQQQIGVLNPLVAEKIREDIAEIPAEWIPKAFQRAAESNVNKWNYVSSILVRWKANGGPDDRPKEGQTAPPPKEYDRIWVLAQGKDGEKAEDIFERLKAQGKVDPNGVIRRRQQNGSTNLSAHR